MFLILVLLSSPNWKFVHFSVFIFFSPQNRDIFSFHFQPDGSRKELGKQGVGACVCEWGVCVSVGGN